MADDVEQLETAQPPAEGETPREGVAEHMIPKSRLDEVIAERNRLRKEVEGFQQAQTQAEEERARQQGEFEKLYQQATERVKALEADVEAQRLLALKRQVAETVGISDFWDRLQGDTEEALQKDAEALKARLPKPQAPPPVGGSGQRERGGEGSRMSPVEVRELAAQMGLDPKAAAEVLGVSS